MRLTFSEQSWAEYLHWQQSDAKVLGRLNALIEECRRHPFKGTGKPGALKDGLSGWWSRRITEKARLVYRVSGSGQRRRWKSPQVRFHYSARSWQRLGCDGL